MKKYSSGFTLLELIIAMAIAVILLGVAVPSFQSAIKSNSVQAQQTEVRSLLNTARSEAVSEGTDVALCPSSDGADCTGGTDWNNGFIVFIDNGAGTGTADNDDRDGDEEVVKVYDYSGPNTLEFTDSDDNALSSLRFNGRGQLANGIEATFKICEPDNDISYARAILVSRSGRSSPSMDLFDDVGDPGSDGVYEDVTGSNLACP